MNVISRKNEFEADAFAVDLGHNENLTEALIIMQKENKSALNVDSWYHTVCLHSYLGLIVEKCSMAWCCIWTTIFWINWLFDVKVTWSFVLCRYSTFHYSHPPLPERLDAIDKHAKKSNWMWKQQHCLAAFQGDTKLERIRGWLLKIVEILTPRLGIDAAWQDHWISPNWNPKFCFITIAADWNGKPLSTCWWMVEFLHDDSNRLMTLIGRLEGTRLLSDKHIVLSSISQFESEHNCSSGVLLNRSSQSKTWLNMSSSTSSHPLYHCWAGWESRYHDHLNLS